MVERFTSNAASTAAASASRQTEMRRPLHVLFRATLFMAYLSGSIASADPLHKFGSEGAWRHEGSGWMFPKLIDSFDRIGAPYTIDGNDDVGAEYAVTIDGMRRSVMVDIYYADSAASGARLETAKEMPNAVSSTAARIASKQAFTVSTELGLAGIKIVHEASGSSVSSLYFFRTPAWIVTIRTAAEAGDQSAGAALDKFVRTLPWDTLDSDPGNLHGS